MENKEKETTTVVAPTDNGGVVESTEEVTTTPTGRERVVERLKAYNPDGVYDSDDALYEGVGGVMDERDRMQENNRKLSEVFRSNPQVASFFIDMMNGVGFYEALGRNFGDDLQVIMNGDEAVRKAYDEGLKEWRSREEERTKRESLIKSNGEADMVEYAKWLEDEGYSPEDRAAFEEELLSMSNAMGEGKFMDFVKMLHRNRRYDADIEAARAEGEIRGRNARIAEERTLPRSNGDGLPSMQDMGRADEGVTAAGAQDNRWSW